MILNRMFRSTAGSVAVEFALLAPLLLLLLFGTIELGTAWYRKQTLVSASREGARFGVVLTEEPISNTDVVTYVQTWLTNAGYPGTYTVTCIGADGLAGVPVTVSVSTNQDYPVLGIMVPGVPSSSTLIESTTMRHE